MRSHGLLLGVCLSLAAGASAAERREAGQHVHGAGELRVAIDGGDVELELAGPAANFVGFEHAPRSPEQERAFAAALASLRDPAQLFSWPTAAGCALVAAEVEAPDHDEDHDEDHDDGDHDDHGDDHGDDDGHSEFVAIYSYRCQSPAALDRLGVRVFARFPGTEQLAAAVVGPRGQSAATLTPTAPDLPLRP